MPTYEYQCKSCEHRFEIWQKMTDEPLTVCPECEGTVRRILFPAGIVFKGSGFYKTDHGSGAAVKDKHQNSQNDNKETTSTTESTTESKTSNEAPKEKAASSESKAAVAAD